MDDFASELHKAAMLQDRAVGDVERNNNTPSHVNNTLDFNPAYTGQHYISDWETFAKINNIPPSPKTTTTMSSPINMWSTPRDQADYSSLPPNPYASPEEAQSQEWQQAAEVVRSETKVAKSNASPTPEPGHKVVATFSPSKSGKQSSYVLTPTKLNNRPARPVDVARIVVQPHDAAAVKATAREDTQLQDAQMKSVDAVQEQEADTQAGAPQDTGDTMRDVEMKDADGPVASVVSKREGVDPYTPDAELCADGVWRIAAASKNQPTGEKKQEGVSCPTEGTKQDDSSSAKGTAEIDHELTVSCPKPSPQEHRFQSEPQVPETSKSIETRAKSAPVGSAGIQQSSSSTSAAHLRPMLSSKPFYGLSNITKDPKVSPSFPKPGPIRDNIQPLLMAFLRNDSVSNVQTRTNDTVLSSLFDPRQSNQVRATRSNNRARHHTRRWKEQDEFLYELIIRLCRLNNSERQAEISDLIRSFGFGKKLEMHSAKRKLQSMLSKDRSRSRHRALGRWISMLVTVRKKRATVKAPMLQQLDGPVVACGGGKHRLKCGHDCISSELCGINCYGWRGDLRLAEISCGQCTKLSNLQNIQRSYPGNWSVEDMEVDDEDEEEVQNSGLLTCSHPERLAGWLPTN